MTETEAIRFIAQILCHTAATELQPIPNCPYCVNGKCQPKMAETFHREAKAVVFMLRQNNLVHLNDSPKILPGLGAHPTIHIVRVAKHVPATHS